MDWLLSPTNFMVELVPAKQNGANGRTMEIMTPKARADIHVNLPALRKLDSMLIETLDSMVSTEVWYAEGGGWDEGSIVCTRQSRRCWLPLPQEPTTSLSEYERKKMLNQGKVVHQILKAAKSINETVLLEMPVPPIIKEALPKASNFLHFKALLTYNNPSTILSDLVFSGRSSLGEELHRILSAESKSAEEMLDSLNLKSEHSALETINRLEAAVFAWKERITEQGTGKSPVRTSWCFIKDPISELKKMEDVGHSILEAYSRVLRNLAFKILSRIGEILQEDILSNPKLPLTTCCFPVNFTGNSDCKALPR
ncbi:RHO guanyl-nucleotide exchange factor 14 [Actinidia rufa]|uniref:RHO guanyl-nucleotide exchange factor 14 n=1 Tax=Actinidia rufa TaxID=165716 RepID=A0A7J0H0V0_9ERIC|nr:RHO guanyl-nucleotide exchange factor 14 [Actinidia rufa]